MTQDTSGPHTSCASSLFIFLFVLPQHPKSQDEGLQLLSNLLRLALDGFRSGINDRMHALRRLANDASCLFPGVPDGLGGVREGLGDEGGKDVALDDDFVHLGGSQ